MRKYWSKLVWIAIALLCSADAAFAAEGAAVGSAALGAGIAMGLAALGGCVGQGKAAGAAFDSIGRNPSAAGKLQTPMIIGLVFIESLVILSFAIAYLMIG